MAEIASDVIEFPKHLKNTFMYIFGGTVLCENSDIAKRIAFGYNLKTVTWEGDVIKPDGMLKGGYI